MIPRNNYSHMIKLLVLVILFIVTLNTVFALGIAPETRTIQLEQYGESEYAVIIVNTLDEEVEIQLNLDDYFSLIEFEEAGTVIRLSPLEQKTLHYKVAFNQSTDLFGEIGKISVSEYQGNGVISSVITLNSYIVLERDESNIVEGNLVEDEINDQVNESNSLELVELSDEVDGSSELFVSDDGEESSLDGDIVEADSHDIEVTYFSSTLNKIIIALVILLIIFVSYKVFSIDKLDEF